MRAADARGRPGLCRFPTGKGDGSHLSEKDQKKLLAGKALPKHKMHSAAWGTAGRPTKPCDYAVKKPYYESRIALFEEYFARTERDNAALAAQGTPIQIALPDGAVKEGVAGVTTPKDIAFGISKGLGKKAVVAKVNGDFWDLFRPMEADCKLQIFTFNDDEGKYTYWHSTAHVLGQALEREFGVDLTIGPPVDEGFYYDCFNEEKALDEDAQARVKKMMKVIVDEKQEFQRAVVTREEGLAMFEENPFKIEVIEGLPAGSTITLYRNGPFVDLCRGPHIPSTADIKAFTLTNSARAHWRGDVNNAPLTRVYGVSFPDKKLLKQYEYRIAEAKKRDHRTLGLQHELFFFHPLSPGSCFFQQRGARVYNKLCDFIREKYWEYGYDEVVTPNIFNFDLWKTSGHADHYRENMFSFEVEKAEYGLKPMNCPSHCLIFKHRKRSFRELPLRLADFGVLHRNEFSGALTGLTRVRRFQQDDAHIFCRPDQIEAEVAGFLKMLDEVYDVFGLTYEMKLSTRPEGYLGELELWDKAEAALESVLNGTGKDWELNPGDGAFYGPKIDITVYDALKRRFQCATVQLDFQLPIRFDLSYVDAENQPQRPVIVHRAILGSVERMYAILVEHFAAKWPMWINPRQVMVVPISQKAYEYAKEVRAKLHRAGMYADADLKDQKMQKKVREAQLAFYNYILVCGEKEMENGTVNVRTRDNEVHGEHRVEDIVDVLLEEKDTRALASSFKASMAARAGAAGAVEEVAAKVAETKLDG